MLMGGGAAVPARGCGTKWQLLAFDDDGAADLRRRAEFFGQPPYRFRRDSGDRRHFLRRVLPDMFFEEREGGRLLLAVDGESSFEGDFAECRIIEGPRAGRFRVPHERLAAAFVAQVVAVGVLAQEFLVVKAFLIE